MTEVQLHSSTGTVRLWNQIIAEYYDYEDRPTVSEDGRIDVSDDCANRLVEEIPTMTLVDNEPEPAAEAEAESEAEAGTEDRSEEQTAETREAREQNQDIGGEQ